MHKLLKQSTSAVVEFGPAVSSADGFTAQTTLAGTGAGKLENTSTGILLSKHGAARAVRSATATASTHDGDGYYLVTLSATDTNTLGRLKLMFAGSATLSPMWDDFLVVPANMYDSITNAAVFQKVDIAAIATVAGNATLLAAMVGCGLIGTVTATGGDATHFQCSDITEATANHYVGKQVWVSTTGTMADQCLGVIIGYTLTGGEGRFTLSPGSPTGETIAAGQQVFLL